jgi:hypothetical protein
MLLGLNTSDVLYLNAKQQGGYNDGHAQTGKCHYITPSFVSPGMMEFFKSPRWQKRVQWDLAFYQAVNCSLDLTIDDHLG